MRVGIYARVSSDSQEARGTIGSQLDALRIRIAKEGDELVGEFCDDGYSGARLDRPGLDALRDQAEAGAFEAVWCLSPDRLARAYVYQVVILDELARLGVRVIFSDAPPIDDDPQARLLTQVQGVIAEYERAKIAERNRRGKLWRSRAGEVVSAKAPYGYRRVARDATGPAHLEVFEPEAAVVRRIFDDYVSGGHSIREIGRRLSTDAVESPTGQADWWHSTVSRVLRNEAYIGRVYFNQTESLPAAPGHGRHAKTQRKRPRDEWIAIACPPVVADAVFEAAQAVSRDNSRFSPRRLPEDVEAWLLRGLVRCGACRIGVNTHKMVTPSGKVHRYYWCRNHINVRIGGPPRCSERNIRADALDAFVFEQVRAALLNPDLLVAGQAAVTAATPVADDELLAAELARLDRKLEANQAERRRLADLYQSGLIDLDDMKRRARDIDARHRSLTDQRDNLAHQRRELAVDNRLRRRVGDFARLATAGIDQLSFQQRQQLLRLVVEEVRVTGWQVVIQLRIPLNDNTDPTGGGGARRPPEPGGGGRRPLADAPETSSSRQGGDRVSSKDGLRSLRGLGVPEEGGQQRQVRLHVEALPIPAEQDVHRQGVAEVVQPGPTRLGAGLEAGVADQAGEDVVDVLFDQAGPPARHQQGRRLGVGEVPVAQSCILGQGLDGAGVKGDLPALCELAVPDGQEPLVGVEVGAVQADRLPESHAGHLEQADEGPVGGGVEGWAEPGGSSHERRHLGLGVEIGDGPSVAGREQAHRGDLGGGIEGSQVAGEATDHSQASGPPRRKGVLGQNGPGQGQLRGDGAGSSRLQEGGEIGQQPAVVLQLVAQRPAHAQVVVDGLADPGHAGTPGQGWASPPSAIRSTFA